VAADFLPFNRFNIRCTVLTHVNKRRTAKGKPNMGKSYCIVHSDKKSIIGAINQFARFVRTRKRKITIWPLTMNKYGNWYQWADVCGNPDPDIDAEWARLMDEIKADPSWRLEDGEIIFP
jgi:hypothetical protein